MPQTTIALDRARAVAGMAAYPLTDNAVISRALATAAGVSAGTLVSYATATTCKAPAASTDITPGSVALGIALRRFWTKEGGAPDYAQYDMVSIVKQGAIWMKCATALAITDAITFLYAGADAGCPVVSGTASSAALGIGSIKLIEPPSGSGQLGLFEVNIP